MINKTEYMDMTKEELEEFNEFMTTSVHTPSGNVISTHKFGNTKVVIRDTYIDNKNIRGLEVVIESFYDNIQVKIDRID